MKTEPRIPTLIGIFILLTGLGSTIFLVETGSRFFTSAAVENKPQEVTVGNVNDSSFSVSWITETPTFGMIEYKETGLLSTPTTAYDIRDIETKLTPRYTHFVTTKQLKTNANYEIKIVSGKNDTTRLAIKTGPTLSAPATVVNPAFGTAVDKNNIPVEDALVHASFAGSQTLSTLVNENGQWVLPLGSLRSADTTRYFTPTKTDQERLFFIGKKGKSIVTATIDNDSPLPLIRLGETYDFTKLGSPPSGAIIAQTANFSQISGSINLGFQILAPTAGMTVPSGKPAIRGTGVAGKQVIITVTETPTAVSAMVTVGTNGLWSWSPPRDLSAGTHVATATSFDAQNNALAQSVRFLVLKSGTSVLGDATPSASVKPSASPSPKPTVRPSATPTPRLSPSPTSIATSTPKTGDTTPTFALLLLGMFIFAAGGLSVFRSRT